LTGFGSHAESWWVTTEAAPVADCTVTQGRNNFSGFFWHEILSFLHLLRFFVVNFFSRKNIRFIAADRA